MDTQDLQRSLKKGPAAVYLVSGEEDTLIDQALRIISGAVLPKSPSADLSLTTFEGRRASAQEVEGAARTVSLFGGRRLIIVREAQGLRADDLKRLAAYLESPVPSSTLVLVARGVGGERGDSRTGSGAKAGTAVRTLRKAVDKGGGVCVDCPRPKNRDMPRLARAELVERGLGVESDGMYALVEAVGEDLTALRQAAEKLALYLGGSGTVTAREVAEVVADTRTQSVFALTDAAAEGAADRALRVLDRMIRDGEAALAILAHLARHFRNLARVQALSRRGEHEGAIREALALHPFVVKKCLMQQSRFAPATLERHLGRIGAADLKIKRGRLAPNLVLEELVLALCGQ